MDIIDTSRNQKAVYWPFLGEDTYSRRLYGPPRELRVRWEDTTEVVVDNQGNEIRSRARVNVGEDLYTEGLLWLGPIAALPVPFPDNPKDLDGAFQIVRFDKVPTLDADDVFRTAYL